MTTTTTTILKCSVIKLPMNAAHCQLSLTFTKGLATANRTRVSIRLAEMFWRRQGVVWSTRKNVPVI